MMNNTNTALHTAAALLGELSSRRYYNTLSAPVRFNLNRQARAARVTIREIAADLGVTLARVREVRAMARVPYLIALDYVESIDRIAARKAVR